MDEREAGERGEAEPAEVPARPVPTPYPRPRPAPEPSPPRGRVRSVLRGANRTVVTLLSVIALVATGYAYLALDDLQDNVQTTDALQQNLGDDPGAPPPPPQDDGATDILLVGADSRTDMQGNPLPLGMLRELRTEDKAGVNTDTLIILRIPKDGGKPTGVSIPRDTWVDVPQGGKAKINSAYGAAKVEEADRLRAEGMTDGARIERDSNQAGRRALVRTVQDFTQIRIDHYAEISLLGFYLLTDALGGIEVCLNSATADKDSGADFAAGPQVVSGGEALSFVRQRKNLPRGDLDRIVRQQVFLSSALNQVLSAGTLTNAERLNQLTETVRRSLVLDPGLDLLQFAEQAKGIATGDMEFVTIPVKQVGARSKDGQSIITVDVGEVRRFVKNLVSGGQQQPSGGGSAPAGSPVRAAVPCVN
ncbi:LytR family transcriptional regulator [Prauserella sp. PE36]|uniref:LCP family protein n=1 Tax=Prauserella sp. PE36 TaxID=1504709 RepID=UPI000DE2DC57|nr:LCP family protein [Prauserella sp. PE36]RBM18478.1 LytR family transcriptional regulator [Prauserella sp. PE36]